MELIVYENIPCPVLSQKESDTFLIFFKNEQKWIFECSIGYGEIIKDKWGSFYLFNGKPHRENGPAVENSNGKKEWYQNGKLHREDGPAVEYSNGNKVWLKNGRLHREDGPAIEYSNGDKYWYQDDKRHRLDGPAIEYSNGDKQWYISGIQYSEEGYNKKIEEMKRDGSYNL